MGRRPIEPRAVRLGDARPRVEQRPLRDVRRPWDNRGRAADRQGRHRAVRPLVLLTSSALVSRFSRAIAGPLPARGVSFARSRTLRELCALALRLIIFAPPEASVPL